MASQRQPLPFETKKSSAKAPKPSVRPVTASRSGGQPSEAAIPDVVSRRMVRRMLVFSGIPTVMAMVIFIGAYLLLSRHVVDFPKVVVLLSTLGCFGLGVVGLTYGVLSASWEEEAAGSRLGISEFRVNLGRMISAWRSAKETPSS